MDLRPLKHLRWNPSIAIANYLKPLTIAVKISIIRFYKSHRSAFGNSILLFYNTKAMLTSLMPEFWQQDTLVEYIFWSVSEKTYLLIKGLVSKFVFCYFYILFWRNIFVLHDFKPLIPLVGKYYLGKKYNTAINWGGCN